MTLDSIPIQLRNETPEDRSVLWHVNAEAFGRPDEADLVDALRDSGDLFASSVVLVDGQVVGHAALSTGLVGQSPVLVLAPVAVLPRHQLHGHGEAVVLHVLRAAGSSPVSVLGDPGYYGRFGFVDAERFGVRPPFAVDPGTFQLLRPEAFPTGVLEYAAPFQDL